MATAELVTGDTGSVLRITCKDNDTEAAIDLTGSTVRLRWEDDTGTVQTRTMTIVTAASGIVSYQFVTDEIIYGTMKFEVEITDSGGYKISNLALISIKTREQLA